MRERLPPISISGLTKLFEWNIKLKRNKATKHRKTRTPKEKPEVESDASKRWVTPALYMSPVMKSFFVEFGGHIFTTNCWNPHGKQTVHLYLPLFLITSSNMHMAEFIAQNLSKNKIKIHIRKPMHSYSCLFMMVYQPIFQTLHMRFH